MNSKDCLQALDCSSSLPELTPGLGGLSSLGRPGQGRTFIAA